MKRGGPDHPKIKSLARRLEIPRSHAAGIAECLWHFTARYAPRGDIGRFSNEALADAVDWDRRDCSRLIAALVANRLIDSNGVHRLVIHDWPSHCDDYVHLSVARARELFADGAQPRRTRLGGAERVEADAYYARLAPQRPAQEPLFYEFPTPDGVAIEAAAAGDTFVRGDPSHSHATVEFVRTACALPSPPLSSPPLPRKDPEAAWRLEREDPDLEIRRAISRRKSAAADAAARARADRSAAAQIEKSISPPRPLAELLGEIRQGASKIEQDAARSRIDREAREHAALEDLRRRRAAAERA